MPNQGKTLDPGLSLLLHAQETAEQVGIFKTIGEIGKIKYEAYKAGNRALELECLMVGRVLWVKAGQPLEQHDELAALQEEVGTSCTRGCWQRPSDDKTSGNLLISEKRVGVSDVRLTPRRPLWLPPRRQLGLRLTSKP
jgi:hypothetical protein